MLRGTLRSFLHLPHRLLPLPLALKVVVIPEHTHHLFATPFDLIGLAPHGRSPRVSCGDCACGHPRRLGGALPRVDTVVPCCTDRSPVVSTSLARCLLLMWRTGLG